MSGVRNLKRRGRSAWRRLVRDDKTPTRERSVMGRVNEVRRQQLCWLSLKRNLFDYSLFMRVSGQGLGSVQQGLVCKLEQWTSRNKEVLPRDGERRSGAASHDT